ncbi:MAG: ATP-binding protein [Okeania sp. SIO3H1]|uniref:ATP-binding protein n=1 Tax=Okeania sp. SIO1I7 TaxID=2607772 RepID=UPI0013C74106|nr:ATP-binding protein [Okeania sp. SIO1I7]NEN92078.1 ATP-binding protein [Okeania sp. SIO3H1]NET26832.1 ATP-binding protein [Okeania sp. SIO1I7]
MDNLLESFREAYRNLELLPLLTPKALAKFRVEYGTETIEELQQLVEDSPSGDSKIIFAGHRGCGKSTLLAQFCQQIEDKYFVVFFSISDSIEMSDVNHINILFAIAVRLMEKAQKQQVKIKSSTKDQFYKWFAKRTRTETDEFKAEGTAGFDLFKIITGKLKADATIREEIKQEFLRKISDLIARINEIAAVIESASGKEILVVIDDLDKIDLGVVRQVYEEHIKALFQPNFRIIFTVPISALREVRTISTLRTETNNQIVTMPVSKLFKQGERRLPNAVPIPEPTAMLTNIIYKRISPELIEPETVEKIIVYSGGVLRELVRITNECCRICLRLIRRRPGDLEIKINAEVLEEALINISIDFDTPIGTKDYAILQQTYKDFMPADPQEGRFLDLLHGLYVLEYRNAQLWYDIHPIVTELLQRKGELINNE